VRLPVSQALHGMCVQEALCREHPEAMAASDDFLIWVKTALYEAELALHNGDAAPRRALWSPVARVLTAAPVDGGRDFDRRRR
jgi:hypothetical protein